MSEKPKEDSSAKRSLEKEQTEQRKGRSREQDDYLEEALEETFPASDPIAPGHVDGDKKAKPHRTTAEGCVATR